MLLEDDGLGREACLHDLFCVFSLIIGGSIELLAARDK